MAGGIASDYCILISHAAERPEAKLYAFSLRDSIPPFALPLQAGDQEPVIDLNRLLGEVYDEAGFRAGD